MECFYSAFRREVGLSLPGPGHKEWHWDIIFSEYVGSMWVLFIPYGDYWRPKWHWDTHVFLWIILIFPCQYHSLAIRMRSVMEKCALVQVSVWVFWPSAVTMVQSIGDLWRTKRRSDILLSMYSGLLCQLFTPCEINGGRIGAGTDFSLSLSFHQYPIPIFCMKILPERQTSEVGDVTGKRLSLFRLSCMDRPKR
jgi:hypothetical protein